MEMVFTQRFISNTTAIVKHVTSTRVYSSHTVQNTQ